ncbi:uncharacterized protein MELLADRAFT_94773 [Melampsora larici-populina 98AG31]|uniref:SET domain-containing protein n=1 Tax=Melampsora larici-populina (strain 98AG31 / pathotype 3-4-7) TaxID=747676 RepID=F4S7V4_MELLP|nr:uncharacterized protein MELLADRAFT_94773 [Melampsora larici-populina 98AG31]EGF99276.1 hypothetical protein MELLADRAFT_94773 [Melampsora larici-populina 98AG31]
MYTQQACTSSSCDKALLNKVSDPSRHNTAFNSTRLGSSDARSSRTPKSSVGLVYKFDQVDVRPILESSEVDDVLDGFVKQRCYPRKDRHDWEPICIYLNHAFDHGRGIVFVAYPSVFKEILSTFTVFKPKKDLTDEEKPSGKKFDVVDMPHKGGKDVWRREDLGDFMKTAVDYLPFETRATFATLHGEGETQGEWIKSAFERNNFYHRVEVKGQERPFGAVVFEPTRLNHDCRPNSAYHFDTNTLKLNVHALRDISPGEELTVSYIQVDVSKETRQGLLSRDYGFECGCSLCSSPLHVAMLSDYRIERLKKLNAILDDWTSASEATPTMAEYAITLHMLERLDVIMFNAYLRASLAYNAVGNLEKAKMHASLALASGLVSSGPKWIDWADTLKLEQNPETHQSYKSRLPKASFGF